MGAKVTGRQLLRKTLAKLPAAVKEDLQTSMTKSAEATAARMRAGVQNRSGATSASIRVEPFTRGGIGAIIKAGGPLTTKPVRNGQSAQYDYALAEELGTEGMLAQPFFYPAYRRQRRKIIANSSKAVRKAVDRVTK
jgi:HK97 gp10 family phage protein